MSATDWVTAVLLPLGALFALVGMLGLLRFPTLLGRMHAATKPDTVGLALILVGTSVQLTDLRLAAPLLLVALFQFVTAPVLAQTLSRVVYNSGLTSSDYLVVDELADVVPTRGRDSGGEHGGREETDS